MGLSLFSVAGTAMSAYGQMQAGAAAKAQGASQQTAANVNAAQLDQQATAVRGQTSAQVADNARQTQLIESTVRARAASSGGGGADPTVVGLESGIAGRGEYNNLALLYSGEEKAQGLNTQASLTRYTGQEQFDAGLNNRTAANTKAVGSIFSGASSLYGKYGGSGPPKLQPGQVNGFDPATFNYDNTAYGDLRSA